MVISADDRLLGGLLLEEAGSRIATNPWPLTTEFPSSALAQDFGGAGVHQYGKSVVNRIPVAVHQGGTLALDAAAEQAPQAEQRMAAANLAGVTRAVANDLAVGAQHRFQQRDGAQLQPPFVAVVHISLCCNPSRPRTTGEVPLWCSCLLYTSDAADEQKGVDL